MFDYLTKLGATDPGFICATHPHYDRVAGIPKLLEVYEGRVREYRDSGFRHISLTAKKIVDMIDQDPAISFMGMTSGMERVFNGVKVSVLAPSIYLRTGSTTFSDGCEAGLPGFPWTGIFPVSLYRL